jgi:hypothetical protein
MLALGAALGGLSSGIFGVAPSFVFDSLSFFVSAGLETMLIYRHVTSPENLGRVTVGSITRQYVEGITYLRDHADIFYLVLHKGVLGLLVIGAFQVLQVAISQRIFVIGIEGSIGQGIMYGVVGVGTGIGPFVARYFAKDRDRPQRIAIVVGYILVMIGMLVILPLASFEVVLLGMLLRGLGTGVVWVISSQLLLQLLPNRVRGRVFSTEFALNTLMAAASSWFGGWAIDALPNGIPTLLVWLGGLMTIPAVLWALWIAFGKLTPAEYVYQETPTELIPKDIMKSQSAGE